LVRVEMFLQNECMAKNTLTVSCVKIHGRHAPLSFSYLPTPMGKTISNWLVEQEF